MEREQAGRWYQPASASTAEGCAGMKARCQKQKQQQQIIKPATCSHTPLIHNRSPVSAERGPPRAVGSLTWLGGHLEKALWRHSRAGDSQLYHSHYWETTQSLPGTHKHIQKFRHLRDWCPLRAPSDPRDVVPVYPAQSPGLRLGEQF